MPDWKSKDAADRLLAATIASIPGMKINVRDIAALFGEGATYDSIENRLRQVKRTAAVMRQEVDSGARPSAPPTPKKPRAPKKNVLTGGVATGRVAKSTNSSPTKKRTTPIKKESASSTESGFGDGPTPDTDVDVPGNVLDYGNASFDMHGGEVGMELGMGMDGVWDDHFL
ncbi:hypothetical protein LTR66_008152 [Elasticomyces elasticus]|nr:hypothetical protein LTR66_008152 [Elasticomyces elasticus]